MTRIPLWYARLMRTERSVALGPAIRRSRMNSTTRRPKDNPQVASAGTPEEDTPHTQFSYTQYLLETGIIRNPGEAPNAQLEPWQSPGSTFDRAGSLAALRSALFVESFTRDGEKFFIGRGFGPLGADSRDKS